MLSDIQLTSSSFSDSTDLKSKAPLIQYNTTISTKPICLKIKEKTFPVDTQNPKKQLRLKHLVKQFLLQHPSLKDNELLRPCRFNTRFADDLRICINLDMKYTLKHQ